MPLRNDAKQPPETLENGVALFDGVVSVKATPQVARVERFFTGTRSLLGSKLVEKCDFAHAKRLGRHMVDPENWTTR